MRASAPHPLSWRRGEAVARAWAADAAPNGVRATPPPRQAAGGAGGVPPLALYWYKLQKGKWGEDEFAAHVLPLTSYVRYAESTGFRNAVMKTMGCSP